MHVRQIFLRFAIVQVGFFGGRTTLVLFDRAVINGQPRVNSAEKCSFGVQCSAVEPAIDKYSSLKITQLITPETRNINE